MIAKSIKGASPEVINTELEASMADGFKPTLAIVFISIKMERESISALLDEMGIAIFGASTNAIGLLGHLLKKRGCDG